MGTPATGAMQLQSKYVAEAGSFLAARRRIQFKLRGGRLQAKRAAPSPAMTEALIAATVPVQPAKHGLKYCCPSLPHLPEAKKQAWS